MVGQVWASGTATSIRDAPRDLGFLRADAARAAELHAAMAVPITTGSDIKGVLELFCRAADPVDDAVLMSVQQMATQFAFFLERERVVLALRRSERQYRRLAQTFEDSQSFAHVGSFELDMTTWRAHCSDELYRIFGFAPQSRTLDLDALLAMVVDEERDRVRKAVADAVNGAAMDVRCRIRRADGEARVIRIHASVITDAVSGSRFVGAVLDVTDDERAARERLDLQRELGEVRRISSLGRLASTMAHEFNNVLMGIESFTSFLLRRKPDPETQNAASHIQQSVRRGRAITDEIIRFTRAATPALQPLNVRDWLMKFLPDANALTGGRARLELDDEPRVINGDMNLLNQVLSNLVLNARDASPPDAPIVISARRAASEVLSTPSIDITVTDRGSGIPPENLQRIFEPLFTTKRRVTGLGLAVVHQVVHAHGGTVRVRSEVGVGSEFHVILPLRETADES